MTHDHKQEASGPEIPGAFCSCVVWSYPQFGTPRAQAAGGLVAKPVTPRSQESRAPGEARLPLSPHPRRQEIDPRLEILIGIANPDLGFLRCPKYFIFRLTDGDALRDGFFVRISLAHV